MSDITNLIANMTQAASDLLDALTPEQRQKVTLSLEDEAERRRWFHTPTPRVGLPLVQMTARQQQKVMRLLATGLSEPGYNYVSLLMGIENLVDYIQRFPDRTYGDLPGTRVRDPGNYFVAVFGALMWQATGVGVSAAIISVYTTRCATASFLQRLPSSAPSLPAWLCLGESRFAFLQRKKTLPVSSCRS